MIIIITYQYESHAYWGNSLGMHDHKFPGNSPNSDIFSAIICQILYMCIAIMHFVMSPVASVTEVRNYVAKTRQT